jgi:hypothetical protein
MMQLISNDRLTFGRYCMAHSIEWLSVPEQFLAESNEAIDCIYGATGSLPFPRTARCKAAATCFAIAQEHHESIVVLAEHRLFATCLALVRVVFDAYVRGVWLSICATDKQVEKFVAFNEPPPMADLVKAIDDHPDFEGGYLSGYKATAYKALCDLTHTGGRQVQRWDKVDAIEPNYRLEEILDAIRVSRSIALLSVLGVIMLVDDTDIALAAVREFMVMRDRFVPMPTDESAASA